jgi:oligopeptide transport system substrate-binding protein
MSRLHIPYLSRLLFVLLILAFCSPALNCAGQSGSEELTLFGAAPSSLDPAQCADATSAYYLVEVFSGLVTLDSDLNVICDIAESYKVSSDGTIYTFSLRDGVRFHDGKQVTADDFKYSIERAADPAISSAVAEVYLGDIVGFNEKLDGEAAEVSGVRVVDSKTLEITIDAPKAYFLSKLTHPTAFVVDSEDVASGDEWWKQPNGTGPFRLVVWEEGQRIVLERNEHYYRGVARLEGVTFLLRGSSMMMYENNQIDIASVGANNIDRVLDPDNPLNKELVIAPELSVYYISFNNVMPPFDDVKVRQALCHAIDKDKIIEVLAKGVVSRASGILPPGMPGYNEGLNGLGYNVTLAQQLLAQSSYHGSMPPVVLSVMGGCTGVSAIDSAIAWMWQENLGVNVTIQCVEAQTFPDDLREQGLQMFQIGWIADYPDPENFLDVLFHSQSAENHTAYNNSAVDALLEEARVEGNLSARLAVYQDIEQIIVTDAPWLPLYFGQDYYLVKPWVKGFAPSPMVNSLLKDVWVER